MNKRILWIDNIKAFLIFIVVLGHVFQYCTPNYIDYTPYNYITSFHMALFMFMSGYCSLRTDYSVIKKRFFQLIIPFVSWSFIRWLYFGLYNPLEMLFNPTYSLWFLWALFFISAIFILTIQLSQHIHFKDEYLTTIVAILLQVIYIVSHKTTLFSFDLIAYYFVFYVLGYYARKYDFFKYPLWLTITAIILWGVLCTGYQSNGNVHLLSYHINSPLLRRAFVYFLSSIAIIGLCGLFRIKLNCIILNINTIGEGTLAIYAIHFFYLWLYRKFIPKFPIENTFIYCVGLALAVTLVSYYTYSVLSKSKLLSLLLFGKK